MRLPLVHVGRSFLLFALSLSAVAFLFPSRAAACGASAGSGGVAVCTLEDLREKERKKFHVGAMYSFTSTDILFGGDSLGDRERFAQERHVAFGTFEWRATRRFNVQAGVGSLFGGHLEHATLLGAEERVGFEPGLVGMVGASYVLRRSEGALPFVLLTGQLSGVFAGTEETETIPAAKYSAYDLRLGGAVGWTFFRSVSPYALARTFGGPVFWKLGDEEIVGSDRYRYQLGGGLSMLIGGRVDLFVEGIGLGERGVTAGAGFAF